MKLRIIGGAFKGALLKTPKSLTTRPTTGIVREAFFNICQKEIQESIFLDLFAGSGAMGIEALSRGAKEVFFVENNKTALSCIKENIKLLSLEKKTQVLSMDYKKALPFFRKKEQTFSLIYCDPPYDFSLEQIKDLLKYGLVLLSKEGKFFLEFGTKIPELLSAANKYRKRGRSHIYEFYKTY